jgi:Peptidase propeptide and YPEB domain
MTQASASGCGLMSHRLNKPPSDDLDGRGVPRRTFHAGRDLTPLRQYTWWTMRAGKHLLLILFAVLSSASFSTHADNFVDKRQFSRSSVSLDQAVEMAQARFRAKAVKAETVNDGGRRVHQIRLLSSDGKVWTVRVDAQSGNMY